MNKIDKDFILVEHPIKDKDGSAHAGFYGIFAKEDQEEPNYLQQELLSGYALDGYVTFFGSLKTVIDRLNEYTR